MLPEISWFSGEAAWRIVNALMALHALMLLSVLMRKHWRKSDATTRFLMQALAGFLLATAAGSIESIIQGNPVGVRTTIITAAVFWALMGLMNYDQPRRSRKKKTETE